MCFCPLWNPHLGFACAFGTKYPGVHLMLGFVMLDVLSLHASISTYCTNHDILHFTLDQWWGIIGFASPDHKAHFVWLCQTSFHPCNAILQMFWSCNWVYTARNRGCSWVVHPKLLCIERHRLLCYIELKGHEESFFPSSRFYGMIACCHLPFKAPMVLHKCTCM